MNIDFVIRHNLLVFYKRVTKRSSNGLFEIDLFLRNLNDELLLGILLYVSDNIKKS